MSIFDGTQPPAWLQDLTALPHGQFGHSVGLALGAGLLALQPNEDGDGLKGLGQGLKEARMNESDPNWKVKTKALEGQAVSNWARAATEWQQLDQTNRDMAQWATIDLPALSKYSEELKTDPDAVPPVAVSSKGQQALQQMETTRLRKATLDFKRDNAADMLDIQQQRVDNASISAKQELEDVKYFNKTLPTVKSPADRARIRELQKQGKMADAMTALESADKEKPVAVQAVEARTEGQLKVIDATEKQKRNLEADRQKDRIEVKMLDILGKKQIEKMKEDAAATGKGVAPITEDQYVQRHFNSVLNALQNANKFLSTDKQKSVHDMEADADISLRAMFRASRPNAPKAQPKTTSPFKETQAAPAPTNAPAADPASTNKDPLGLFGQ